MIGNLLMADHFDDITTNPATLPSRVQGEGQAPAPESNDIDTYRKWPAPIRFVFVIGLAAALWALIFALLD